MSMEKPPIDQLDEPFGEAEEKPLVPRNEPMPQHDLDEPFGLPKTGMLQPEETPVERRKRLTEINRRIELEQLLIQSQRERGVLSPRREKSKEDQGTIRMQALKEIAYAHRTGNKNDIPTSWKAYVETLPPDMLNYAHKFSGEVLQFVEVTMGPVLDDRKKQNIGPTPEDLKDFDERIRLEIQRIMEERRADPNWVAQKIEGPGK